MLCTKCFDFEKEDSERKLDAPRNVDWNFIMCEKSPEEGGKYSI